MNVTRADRRLNLREVGDMFWNKQIVCSKDYVKYFMQWIFLWPAFVQMFLLVDEMAGDFFPHKRRYFEKE